MPTGSWMSRWTSSRDAWNLPTYPPLSTAVYSLVGHFAGAKRQVGDKAFIPIMGTGRPKLRRVPIRSLCVVQPRSVPAVSLLLSCDCVAKSSARRDKYSICWEAVSLPWSPAEWAMKRPACLLSVSLSMCVCVCFPPSFVTHSVFKFVNLSRPSALLATVCPSVCLSINLPTCLFSLFFCPKTHQPVEMSPWISIYPTYLPFFIDMEIAITYILSE